MGSTLKLVVVIVTTAIFFLSLTILNAQEEEIISTSALVVFVGEDGLYVIDSSGNPDSLFQVVKNNDGDRSIQPSLSPDGSQIAYQSIEGGDSSKSNLTIVNIDGSEIESVIEDGAQNAEPAWSPDGSQIAFASDKNGGRNIYLLSLDDYEVTQLTHSESERAAHPAWSPDGSRIAYVSNQDSQNVQVYIMDADGSDQQQLTNLLVDSNGPVWSPDGTQIAFNTFDPNTSSGKAHLINLENGSVDELIFSGLSQSDGGSTNVYIYGWIENAMLLLIQNISGMNQIRELYIVERVEEPPRFLIAGIHPSWVSVTQEEI